MCTADHICAENIEQDCTSNAEYAMRDQETPALYTEASDRGQKIKTSRADAMLES